MKFVRYSDWKQLPESADALFAREQKGSIFFSRQWFECLTARVLDVDHTLVLACVVDGDRVMAMLPLMECAGVNTWYSLSLPHGYTPLYSLLLADDDQEQVLSCLVRALDQLPVNALLLEPVARDDGNIQRLAKLLEQTGFRCEYDFRHYNWVHHLQGQSYQEYMAGRPATVLNTISRKKRRLEREHGYEIRLFTGAEALPRMTDYHVVYNASWKQNEVRNADLQHCFVEAFSQAGWSRLAIMYIKGQPVAAQLWFVYQNKAIIFRLAYDKAWREYSTGSILTSFLMEYVIDTDRVAEIDFLTGNEAYKQDWMSDRRERFLLSCIKNKSPAGRYERVVASLKQMLKWG
ncbi:MAG TPA: GNAT family N-acetyltransferase [Candidatus Paceibacterota bacterium]